MPKISRNRLAERGQPVNFQSRGLARNMSTVDRDHLGGDQTRQDFGHSPLPQLKCLTDSPLSVPSGPNLSIVEAALLGEMDDDPSGGPGIAGNPPCPRVVVLGFDVCWWKVFWRFDWLRGTVTC